MGTKIWTPNNGVSPACGEIGTFMADLDVEEMFLNFSLHQQLQELCGFGLTKFMDNDREKGFGCVVWEVWLRAAMGVRLSPYQCVQGLMVAEEEMLGSHLDITIVFRWTRI